MRICLLSLTYPPASSEGIARQRQALAMMLAYLGHDVHVVTIGRATRSRREHNITIHEIADVRSFSGEHPEVHDALVGSQMLYEGMLQIHQKQPIDIVDVPFWAAQGLISSLRFPATVIWLQTTTAQLIGIQGREPTKSEQILMGLEQQCLEYAGGILGDSGVVLDAVRQHYMLPANVPQGIAYLGLAPVSTPLPDRRNAHNLEILVVGRLERRKGTPLLFDVLPTLMQQHPQLRVRFVGRDNSAYDGWQQAHNETYPATFARRFPELDDRVMFDGYLSDAQLFQRYNEATLLVVPSLYESFGLVYLEAMRVGLPIVTFDSGSTPEIFPRAMQDGAAIVALGNTALLIEAINQLLHNPELRLEIGMNGYRRFQEHYTDSAMAQQTLAFYEQVLATNQQIRQRASRVYQVMEALDVGDAVSDITLGHVPQLAALGQPTAILARYAHPQFADHIRPLDLAQQRGSAIIFHYWNYSNSTWLLDSVRGPKAVYYHNITPAAFYDYGSIGHQNAIRGYDQLDQIADQFDLVIGDSRYNVQEFLAHRSRSVPHLHIYPVVDAQALQEAQYALPLLQQLRHSGEINIVFVGRIVRNKRQDRLMALFDYYYRTINRKSRLWLVGNNQSAPSYRDELYRLRDTLSSRDRIMFTGKVSEPEMMSYFRGANVFVCASEHEGFCVPLIQAMAFEVPVMAFAAAAVPETMGDAGILINTWDVPYIAELLHILTKDRQFRMSIITNQQANLARFSLVESQHRITSAIRFLTEGAISPHIIQESNSIA